MAVTSLRVAGALLLALIANAALLSVLLVQNASRHSAHHSDNINDNALELIYHKEGDVGSYSNLVSGGGKAGQSTTGRVMGAARDVQTQKVLLSGATRADSNGGVRSVKDMSADNIGSGGVKKVVHVLSRSQRSTILKVADTGRYLNDVIASLTSAELQSLEPGVAKTLVPALVGLESMVLRELERLHAVSLNQELRIEQLETRQLDQQDLLDSLSLARKEPVENQKQEPLEHDVTAGLSGNMSVQKVASERGSELYSAVQEETWSGSGEGVTLSPPAMTTLATATTTNGDNAIINHIYEIYSSLTSLEHKVTELGSSLTAAVGETYRQRSSLVRIEDIVGELGRTQRNLVMRTTMHTFKLSDMEQFKGQTEILLQTTSGTLSRFQGRLESFKDKVTEQQDEMQNMRAIFGRLEQMASELRAADTYKAHDIQELKQSVMQLESRLSHLYHSLDRSVGNLRWDVKTYLDHLCSSNSLQC
ncbi:uncharacterized protein LOC112553366 isoform X2 [Pomacea canaliculata]|uniref:uncharacterized protein LOC112553366 isoform X2 n=1 Tax=Pomacea canaliculata TaxID=400727 RepID=UPI000D73D1E7|nr:uncharacterized protein LOC112553366 isoform X2 [Pomacea canaliculata]